MTRLRSLALTAAFLAASAASAAAQGYGYGYGYGPRPADEVDARQSRQIERIDRGIRDGSLTSTETAALAEEQRRINAYERRARADGNLDPYERANLRAMQDNASRRIQAERRDFEGRSTVFDPPAYRPWWRRWW